MKTWEPPWKHYLVKDIYSLMVSFCCFLNNLFFTLQYIEQVTSFDSTTTLSESMETTTVTGITIETQTPVKSFADKKISNCRHMVNKKTQCHESELLPLDQTPKQSKKMTVKIPLKTKKFKSVGVNTNITFPVNMNPQDDSDSQDMVSP